MTTIYSKHIITPTAELSGYIHIENGKITRIEPTYTGPYEDFSEAVILPGFIDQHTHGWGRGSFLFENDEQSLRMMIEDQAKEGVTGFLATSFTDTLDYIHQSINACNALYGQKIKGTKLLGLHLEGPFINPLFKGAQKGEYCLLPTVEVMDGFYKAQKDPSMIKLITLAPELEGAKEVINYCKARGIQVAAGHTGATFEQMMQAQLDGVGGVTHMYGAMSGMHHRKPGVVGAALYNDKLICEFAKQTGITVRHEVFNITYRIKGPQGIIMCTDCLGNGKQKEPYYHANRNVNFIPNGDTLIERDANGNDKVYDLTKYEDIRKIELSFMGSVQNLVKNTPMSFHEIAQITSTNCAKYLGIDDQVGSIEVGKCADFTVVSKDLDLLATIIDGEVVYRA